MDRERTPEEWAALREWIGDHPRMYDREKYEHQYEYWSKLLDECERRMVELGLIEEEEVS